MTEERQDLLARAGVRIGEQAREISELRREVQALKASLALMEVLADQRNALIDELLQRIPETQKEAV